LQESYEKLRQILGLNWEVSKIGPQVIKIQHRLAAANSGQYCFDTAGCKAMAYGCQKHSQFFPKGSPLEQMWEDWRKQLATSGSCGRQLQNGVCMHTHYIKYYNRCTFQHIF